MKADTPSVTVRLLNSDGQLSAPIVVPKIVRSEAAWRARLTEDQYRITRTQGTERAFCGVFYENHLDGVYACVGCGLPLFHSDAKFESGTGWPSFFQPIAEENVAVHEDRSHGMLRTEIHCARCESHLGHVFPDGPPPTRERHCLNSASLVFFDSKNGATLEKVGFGAGCFWGVEETLRQVKGVTATRVGFSGGHTFNPSYDDVCSHTTGHAETVEAAYDPNVISFEALLAVFWKSHDPAAHHPAGGQYRSAVFFHTPAQEATAHASAAQQPNARAIVTEISFAGPFFAAEEYHQLYYEKHAPKASAPVQP